MTCLHPDLGRSGYVMGCRCDRHKRLDANYQNARRQKDRRANDRARAHGGGSRRPLMAKDAILGVNCMDPRPLRPYIESHGADVADSQACKDLAARMGITATALEHRTRRAIERGWISEKHIDELCCGMRMHPTSVYGDAYYGLVCEDATYDELYDAGIIHDDEQAAA